MFFLPDLFSPYIEGREKAIDRNWNDMNWYNKIQQGQLQNLLDLAQFDAKANAPYEDLFGKQLDNQYKQDTYNMNIWDKYYGLDSKALYNEYIRQWLKQQGLPPAYQDPTFGTVSTGEMPQATTPPVPNAGLGRPDETNTANVGNTTIENKNIPQFAKEFLENNPNIGNATTANPARLAGGVKVTKPWLPNAVMFPDGRTVMQTSQGPVTLPKPTETLFPFSATSKQEEAINPFGWYF